MTVLKIKGARLLEDGETALPLSAAELTVTYHRNTEYFSTVTIAYIPYNSNYYQVSVNGAAPAMVVSIRDVQSLTSYLESH